MEFGGALDNGLSQCFMNKKWWTGHTQARRKLLVIRVRWLGSLSARELQIFFGSWDVEDGSEDKEEFFRVPGNPQKKKTALFAKCIQ